jgi:hypothetical protein
MIDYPAVADHQISVSPDSALLFLPEALKLS